MALCTPVLWLKACVKKELNNSYQNFCFPHQLQVVNANVWHQGSNLHPAAALALKAKGPRQQGTGQGGRAEIQLAGHKSPFLPSQQEKETMLYWAWVPHTSDPSTNMKALPHLAHTCPESAVRSSWEVAAVSVALRPGPSACLLLILYLLPNFQAIPTSSSAPDLSHWLRASTICGFPTMSHLSPPNPADIQVLQPGPTTRLPASPMRPPTGMQTWDCHSVFPNRWLER